MDILAKRIKVFSCLIKGVFHFFYDLIRSLISVFLYEIFPKIFRIGIFAFWLIMIVTIAVYGFRCFFIFPTDILKVKQLISYRLPQSSKMFDDQGNKIAEFSRERRTNVKFEDVPKMLFQAIIAVEDEHFLEHSGIDFASILRAAKEDVKVGSLKQGASTLTQQLARNIDVFHISRKKTFSRKLREAAVAYRIDKEIPKKIQAEIYFNENYMGRSSYGLIAAADSYFGKNLNELHLSEMAFLAGLFKAPSAYSHNFKAAKNRMRYVLFRMKSIGMISDADYQDAINDKIVLVKKKFQQLDYYTEQVRRYVLNKYGAKKLYMGGLKIYIPINLIEQRKAQIAIRNGLFAHDRRHGYRGAIDYVKNIQELEKFLHESRCDAKVRSVKYGEVYQGLITDYNKKSKKAIVIFSSLKAGLITIKDVKWAESGAGLKVQDIVLVKIKDMIPNTKAWNVSLYQEPLAQAALISVEAKTGYVKCMVGGRDFRYSEFNRAYQAKRQMGSAFKTFTYAAAFAKDYSPNYKIADIAHTFNGWTPQNYSRKFSGNMVSLRNAYARSLNNISVELVNRIGLSYTIDFLGKLGISTTFNQNDLSMALGSRGVSLFEAVRAYSVFANNGLYRNLVLVERILDADGNILEDNRKQRVRRVVKRNVAFQVLDIMNAVTNYGTARNVNLGKNKQGLLAIGKTGTTSANKDAWFIGIVCKPEWGRTEDKVYAEDSSCKQVVKKGITFVKNYHPQYVSGVWVGYDKNVGLGEKETGSKTAAPIWKDFVVMKSNLYCKKRKEKIAWKR